MGGLVCASCQQPILGSQFADHSLGAIRHRNHQDCLRQLLHENATLRAEVERLKADLDAMRELLTCSDAMLSAALEDRDRLARERHSERGGAS